MFYYQHHIGDFIKDTANLDDHQLATYLRMMWIYYTDETPFDDDPESIAFAVRSDEKTVRLLLKHFFDKSVDKWHHNRCDREIDGYKQKSEKARGSANARWSNAKAMRTHNERTANEPVLDANQEPNNLITKEPIIKDKTATSVAPPDGVSQSVWDEFVAHRKRKKETVSKLVVAGIQKEADKAGWTLEDALSETVIRGWKSFKAIWVAKKSSSQAQALSFAERDQLAKQKRWEEMTGRQWPTESQSFIDVDTSVLELK